MTDVPSFAIVTPQEHEGETPAKTQGDVRASSSGRLESPKAFRQSWDRGSRATGTWEGSLSMEGTSGRDEPLAFHEAVDTAT